MMTTNTDAADFAAMRQAMVSSQLRTTAVDDPRVVEAMATVPREAFVPDAARGLAYRDAAIPLGRGRFLNTPMATGRLINAAQIIPDDRVLLIGAATGYAAAVLTAIGAVVTAVEQDETLLTMARDALGGSGVVLVTAPLVEGAPEHGPYDVLIIDGSVEEIPTALIEQLRVGGRITTGLVERGVMRLAAGRRTAGGHGVQPFVDAECVVLPGFARPAAFSF